MRHEKHIEGVPVVYSPPFAPVGGFRRVDVIEDKTLLEIVRSFPDLPPRFEARGRITINGHEIKRDLWHLVRPKRGTAERPIAVSLHYPPGKQGGGGGGGSTLKSVVAIVGAIALAVLTYGIASGAVFGALGTIGFGITGAQLLAGAVGIVGALALSALTAPPTQGGGPGSIGASTDDTNTDSKEPAGAQANVIQPGGAIPRVVGTRKVFPPLAVYPLVELVGDDEYVEAIYALNGPHAFGDVRIDGAAVDDFTDVQVEVREGWEDDDRLSNIARQGRMITPNVELTVHKVNPASTAQLVDAGNPLLDVPVWHGAVARNSPDEIWIHLQLPGGLSSAGSSSQIAVPIRVRMRLQSGGDWINFPEVHLADATLAALRKAILIKWKNDEPIGTVPTSSGFVAAYADLAFTDPITTNDSTWDTHSSFGTSGALYSGVEATTTLRRTNLFSNRVEFYVDEAQIPKGRYEVQIKRGAVYAVSSFVKSSYSYSGVGVTNFFNWWNNAGTPSVVFARSNVADRTVWARLGSVWNSYPIQRKGFALIGLKARNRNLSNVSVEASGYVKDYNSGTGLWEDWTTTSNPAPHYRDALVGQLNLDPLPLDLLGDTELLEWRSLCATYDWTLDAIVDDMRMQDFLTLAASCGYAKPYQSDKYTVTVDKDRSAETPNQVFSSVNSTNFRYEKAFARVPFGLNVTYRDNSLDDDKAQTIVYQRDEFAFTDESLIESVTFDGMVEEAKVAARAQFDLDQANLRSTFYYLDTDVEAIACRRGDLVAVNHDVIDRNMASARIVSRVLGSPSTLISGFVLDSEVPIVNETELLSVADVLAVADMLLVGITTGVSVRHYGDGTVTTHALSNVTGSTATITLATPITDDGTIKGFADTDDEHGCLVTVGQLGSEYLRLVVAAIIPTKDLKASLVLVDEAPALERFGA